MGDTGRKTGGYIYNERVISGLRESGFEVDQIVACGAATDEQRTAAPRLGATLNPSAFDAIVVDALARIVVAPHLDLWRSARPVVAMVHELPSVAGAESAPQTVARELVYEEPLLRADRLVAVSDHGRTVLELRGVPTGRIHVVPPGFDRLISSGGVYVEEGGPVGALCVAQWIPRKGILSLVEAWTSHERPGAVLVLVGETDAEPGYAARVRTAIGAAAQGSIVVAGAVDDEALGAAYASADLFVLPSRYEGYGIVYAEALARGLPIVACDVGPVPDLVGSEAAILIRPEDRDALSAALDLLLGDAALRERMSAAARRRASRLPRWEDAVDGFEEALRAAVSARTRRTEPM